MKGQIKTEQTKQTRQVPGFITAVIAVICILASVFMCGCTYGPVADTGGGAVSGAPANTENPAQQGGGEGNPAGQTLDTTVSVSWKDFYPDYSEQEKTELIEEAKRNVMRVFPDVDESSLNGRWQEWRFKGYEDPNYGPPTIIFEYVDDTSSKYLDNYGEQNIVRIIEADPVTREAISYIPSGYSPPRGFTDLDKLSFEEGGERGVNFIKSLKGTGFFEANADTLIVESSDRYDDYMAGLVPVSVKSTYKGIPYFTEGIFVQYDAFSDKVEYFFDDFADPELIHGLTTLSPEPDITIDEAKQIFVDTVRERYPEDDLQISFDTEYMQFEDSLVWMDDFKRIYNNTPRAIPLAWHLTFKDQFMGENRRSAFIDAHTGEVTGHTYRDPR